MSALLVTEQSGFNFWIKTPSSGDMRSSVVQYNERATCNSKCEKLTLCFFKTRVFYIKYFFYSK